MKIHIRDFYYGPHSRYDNWKQGDWGVGVAEYRINKCVSSGEKLELTVGKDKTVYSLWPETFRKNSIKRNSTHIAREGVRLLVVPMSVLSRYKEKK